MKHLWAVLALSVAVSAQSQSTRRLSEFPGATVADKIAAAKSACGLEAPTTCNVILDREIPKVSGETLPTDCDNCNWIEERIAHDHGQTSGGLPSGMIAFLDSGSCPAGWTEVASAGNYILLTVAANNDAGTTGGSNSYTPQGTVSATFVGSQVTSSAVTAGTPSGTVSSITATATTKVAGGTSSSVNAAAQAHTHAAPTFTGSALPTHSHTVTPAGTVNGTFSGTTATIQPTFYRLIPCKKQ